MGTVPNLGKHVWFQSRSRLGAPDHAAHTSSAAGAMVFLAPRLSNSRIVLTNLQNGLPVKVAAHRRRPGTQNSNGPQF